MTKQIIAALDYFIDITDDTRNDQLPEHTKSWDDEIDRLTRIKQSIECSTPDVPSIYMTAAMDVLAEYESY